MNMISSPRISVIVPTHNRPHLLSEALESLRTQTFGDWEAIVVDDASSPPALIVGPMSSIRLVRHDVARGGAAAKNTGIQNARGDVLAFLDDDDCYAPEYLERAITTLDRRPDLDVVFMGVSWFGTNGDAGQRNYDQAMHSFLGAAGGRAEGTTVLFDMQVIRALLKSVPMALQRPVVRRSAIDQIGIYRPDCLLWDCDWAISAALNARVGLMMEGLYLQRSDGQGYSSQAKRIVEHLHSGIEIKDRLWRQSQSGKYAAHQPAFRLAAASAWFDLAWHYYQQGNRFEAWLALRNSARRRVALAHLKLMMRLAWLSPSHRSSVG